MSAFHTDRPARNAGIAKLAPLDAVKAFQFRIVGKRLADVVVMREFRDEVASAAASKNRLAAFRTGVFWKNREEQFTGVAVAPITDGLAAAFADFTSSLIAAIPLYRPNEELRNFVVISSHAAWQRHPIASPTEGRWSPCIFFSSAEIHKDIVQKGNNKNFTDRYRVVSGNDPLSCSSQDGIDDTSRTGGSQSYSCWVSRSGYCERAKDYEIDCQAAPEQYLPQAWSKQPRTRGGIGLRSRIAGARKKLKYACPRIPA